MSSATSNIGTASTNSNPPAVPPTSLLGLRCWRACRPATTSGVLFQFLELSVYGNFFRYKRDQEREADLTGLGYLNAGHLRPQAASIVWQNLMGEAEASARVRGLKKPNFNALAFTASHPPDGERAAYLSELALPDGATAKMGRIAIVRR